MDPLKALLQQKREEKKLLNKQVKKAGNYQKVQIEKQLQELEWFLNRFKVSVMEPVYIQGILINYKLYSKIMKKLKGFGVSQSIEDGHLTIIYKNTRINGTYTLMDLSTFFPKKTPFPKKNLIEE